VGSKPGEGAPRFPFSRGYSSLPLFANPLDLPIILREEIRSA